MNECHKEEGENLELKKKKKKEVIEESWSFVVSLNLQRQSSLLLTSWPFLGTPNGGRISLLLSTFQEHRVPIKFNIVGSPSYSRQ